MEERAISGDIFNVGSPERVSIIELADKRAGADRLAARSYVFVPHSEVYGLGIEDVLHREPAIEKIGAAIGWRPSLDLDRILGDVIDWARRAAAPKSRSSSVARVVVTGGAGFIGSHVADAFLARGDDVLVVDDLSTGARENVPAGAAFEQVDIVDAGRARGAFAAFAPTLVCHLAAQASVTVSVERPELDCSVERPRDAQRAARGDARRGAPVVFASTGGALYGNDAPLPTPRMRRREPLSPYGASKLAGEAYVSTWARLHGRRERRSCASATSTGRGRARTARRASSRSSAAGCCAAKPPPLRGNGAPTRDYVHVTDVARAFVAAADGGRAGTFNVGTGRRDVDRRAARAAAGGGRHRRSSRSRKRCSRASSRRACWTPRGSSGSSAGGRRWTSSAASARRSTGTRARARAAPANVLLDEKVEGRRQRRRPARACSRRKTT